MRLADRIEKLELARAYDEALDALMHGKSGVEQCPYLLVTKGRLIQLAEHTSLGLDEAEKAFQQALRIDKEYIPAMLHLAWYYLNVCDDPASAKRYFDKAMDILSDYVAEAVEGSAKCLQEMADGVNGALNFLENVRPLILDDRQLDRIKGQIRASQ